MNNFNCDPAYINSNPDEYVDTLNTKQLEDTIKLANELYYNDTSGSPLEDNVYDSLVWNLNKRYKKENKVLSDQIGIIPVEKIRTKLPYFMPSLNKVKVGKDLVNFLNNYNELTWSLKLDGVSGMIVYEQGIPIKAYLRGNGETGGDISHVLKCITLPELKSKINIVVRGEFVMKHSVFRTKDNNSISRSIKNSRNYVSGKLNATNSSPEELKDIDFVSFDIVSSNSNNNDGSLPIPSDSFNILISLGFNVVKHGNIKNVLASDIVNLYIKEYEISEYPIDGIVIAEDIPRHIPNILSNPNHTVAFKMNLTEQIKDTIITGISWQISRHGRYIPVAEFKNVFIDGRRIHRATAHNAYKCVKEWGLGLKSKIQVTASGGVIPKIVSVIKSDENISPILPPDIYPWEWKGRDIVLVDPESCPIVHLKRHIFFFTVLKIPGIREGMLKRMHEGGLDNLQSIIKADQNRFKKIRGIGPKKAKDYYENIRKQINSAKLYRLMVASNTFNRGLGKTYLRLISVNIPTFLSENDHKKLKNLLIKLKGIGPKRADTFIEGVDRFKEFLQDYIQVEENNRKYFEDLAKNGFNKYIQNFNFVFTNLEDEELEDYILDHQGKIQKEVTNTTSAVITGNLLDVTTKQRKAAELGIKVYTLEEFKRYYQINY